jgi:hypothetical protein
MHSTVGSWPTVVLLAICALSTSLVLAQRRGADANTSSSDSTQRVDLAERLAVGKLRAVNCTVTALQGTKGAVHVSEHAGNGVIWVEGSQLSQGMIEVDVRGRDVFQRSFLGIAFHRQDDSTYEAVYLRPFNFRSTDPVRHDHAVQYIALPAFDWPRLREKSPEQFENPVDASISPTDWVTLRLVVKAESIDVYVGSVKTPALVARRLVKFQGGAIGLWTGNTSDGDFANLRITSK